jgi:hypothetical protein
MMNLIQVQDDLKNFSQDQLVQEMQQPSGNAPQFLVLAELNRRKRVKGDLESRQAQQQPTVAEEVVASAGVPQNQMMGMPEAMAPQSAVSDGVGTSAPMKMASGGLMQFGNDIRNSMSQQIDPYLEEIENEAEAKFNIDLDQNNMGQIRPMPFEPTVFRPGGGGNRPIALPSVGIGGKGFSRGVNESLPQPLPFTPRSRNRLTRGMGLPRGGMDRPLPFNEGGVIRAANGFAGSGRSSEEIIKGMEEKDAAKLDVDEDIENISEDVPTNITDNSKDGQKPKSNYTIEPILSNLETTSVEEDILELQKGLQKEREMDKNLAIAQAGLGILASDAPTLGQAVGEGASTGLEAYREAGKRYQEGVIDLINARAKIAAGRKKGKLSASDIMSNLNKTREQLYGKPGDLGFVKSELTPEVENRLKAQEQYLVKLLQDYGVNLPVATAIS